MLLQAKVNSGANVGPPAVLGTLLSPKQAAHSMEPKNVFRRRVSSVSHRSERSLKNENSPISDVLDLLPGGERRFPPAAGSFLANTLRRRWQSYRKQLRVCRNHFSERTVHDLRVASRRLIAQLVMLGSVGVGGDDEWVRRVLKRRLKALSELRDVHVQRLFIEQQVTRFPELVLFCDDLRRRERKLERAAAAKVKGFKTRKLRKSLLALEDRLVRQSGQENRLTARVTQATAAAFADVVRRRQAIDPAKPNTIHRTRIAFKKFRYMLESLSPELTGLSKRDLRELAYYQRRMGILQDLEVMQQLLAGYVRQHRDTAEVLEPFARHLRARRARALRSFLKSADALHGYWPLARVSGEAV
jgi:CHAD domain-containing protein